MSWIWISQLVLVLVPSFATAQTKLVTITENRDGLVEDIAGPRTFVDPDNSRLWLAEGRIRSSLRMTDKARMRSNNEERTFSSGHTGPVPIYEKLVALEFNDANGRLYTLTEAGVYREETAAPYSQPAPGPQAFLNFADLNQPQWLEVGETFQDLKVWPGTDRVFLLTTHRIIALRDTTFLALASTTSWSTEMFPPSTQPILDTTSDTGFNSLEVRKFLRFRICKEVLPQAPLQDHLIAVVLAETSGYSLPRPRPTVAILCDLGAFSTDTPVFDSDPAATVQYAYYLSAPAYPGGNQFLPVQYSIFDVDTFVAPGNRVHAYVACGVMRQIQELDLAGALPRPSSQTGSLVPVAQHTLPEMTQDNDHAANVLADDLDPTRRFFVVSHSAFHTHLPQSPNDIYVTLDEPFGKGCSHDMLRSTAVSLPADVPLPDFVTTATGGVSDYRVKSVDVTNNNLSGIPLVGTGGKVYSLFTVDGGVVLPHAYSQSPTQRDDVYISTWGGVVKFNPDASGNYTSDPDAYQPAVAVGEVGSDVHVTEAIDSGSLGEFAFNRDALFTASAKGDFLAYGTNQQLGFSPVKPLKWVPILALLPSGWNYLTDEIYGNDVAYVDLQPTSAQDGKYVLVDLTRIFPADFTRRTVVLAYKWSAQFQTWTHFATTTELVQNDVAIDGALAANITVAPNKNWILVAHKRGFFSVKQNLATTGLSFVTDVFPTMGPPPGVPASVEGLAATDTRVFAFLFASPALGSEIRIYDINALTGVIDRQNYTTIPATRYQVVPGSSVARAFRGRFDPPHLASNETPVNGSVYFACEKYVLKFDWAQGLGGPTTDLMTFAKWWGSDYADNFTDCLPFTRTSVSGSPRAMLMVKDRETFAITQTQ